MNPELERSLCERYPKIFAKRHDRTSPMCWGIGCGDGWYPLLDELCAQLQHETDANGAPQVVASQVKEKFGDLRFHVSEASPAQQTLIEAASARSRRTCEICGAPAAAKPRPSDPTRCTDHLNPELTPEQQVAVDELAAKWERRLACLKEPDAAAKLRAMMDDPGNLDGNVIAGKSY